MKSLKNSTIISCILPVKKIEPKGFNYSVEKSGKDERLKELKHVLSHMELETSVSDLWLSVAHLQLSPSQGHGDSRALQINKSNCYYVSAYYVDSGCS